MPEALNILHDMGVNPVEIVDFAELFFFEEGKPVELSFERFMDMVLDLRESKTCTVKDVWNIWMQMKKSTNRDVTDMIKTMDFIPRHMMSKFSELTPRPRTCSKT